MNRDRRLHAAMIPIDGQSYFVACFALGCAPKGTETRRVLEALGRPVDLLKDGFADEELWAKFQIEQLARQHNVEIAWNGIHANAKLIYRERHDESCDDEGQPLVKPVVRK